MGCSLARGSAVILRTLFPVKLFLLCWVSLRWTQGPSFSGFDCSMHLLKYGFQQAPSKEGVLLNPHACCTVWLGNFKGIIPSTIWQWWEVLGHSVIILYVTYFVSLKAFKVASLHQTFWNARDVPSRGCSAIHQASTEGPFGLEALCPSCVENFLVPFLGNFLSSVFFSFYDFWSLRLRLYI